jgi:hypothetical protein
MDDTTIRPDEDLPIGFAVYTADGYRLGFLLDGDTTALDVSDGYALRKTYRIPHWAVAGTEPGALVLRNDKAQVLVQRVFGAAPYPDDPSGSSRRRR